MNDYVKPFQACVMLKLYGVKKRRIDYKYYCVNH